MKGAFFIFFGLLLLGMTPSIGIVAIAYYGTCVSSIVKILFRISMLSQIIVILLPSCLFFLAVLYIGERKTPVFIRNLADPVTYVSCVCILLSMFAHIVFAFIERKKTSWMCVLLQFICAGSGLFAIDFAFKVFMLT